MLIETLPTGELRVSPAETVRRITRERANQLVAENREALELLAAQDGAVTDAGPTTEE